MVPEDSYQTSDNPRLRINQYQPTKLKIDIPPEEWARLRMLDYYAELAKIGLFNAECGTDFKTWEECINYIDTQLAKHYD